MGPLTSRTCESWWGWARVPQGSLGSDLVAGGIMSHWSLSAWAVLATLLPSFSRRQLDKNQISCIEDGAFRALRGLEVL